MPSCSCARLNMVVNGSGNPDLETRQARASGLICDPVDLSRIRVFAATRPGHDFPIVFFRGQILELVRWAVRCCPAIPDDGTAFSDPAPRKRLLQAALVAGSHSMRSSWISTAARNGASVWKMKEISRHKSTDVLAGYVREAELFQQHASVGMY
jgi:hypothetical protein